MKIMFSPASGLSAPLRFLKVSVLALCSLTASHAFADLQLKADAFREVEVVGKSGKKEKQMQAITSAVPGQEVVYVIAYRNTGAKPAESVVVSNPVPEGLVFQPGSAQGAGTRSEVSVDGGKQFGALELLKVNGPDGTPRPARAEDVTHVRWTLLQPVKPAGEGKVTYRAVLK